jgi:hypothetical protein
LHAEREASKGRFCSNSDGERFDNEDRDARRVWPGPCRPPPGGYRLYYRDTRPGVEWEGRYSPVMSHLHSSSSSRGPYRGSRSPEPYTRAADKGGWWGETKKDWNRQKGSRYDEYPPLQYADDHYAYDYEVLEFRGGGCPLQRSSPVPPAKSFRGAKVDSNMEPPTKCPIQFDSFLISTLFYDAVHKFLNFHYQG